MNGGFRSKHPVILDLFIIEKYWHSPLMCINYIMADKEQSLFGNFIYHKFDWIYDKYMNKRDITYR